LSLGEFSLVWVILFYAVLISVTFGWSRIRNWFTAHPECLQKAFPIPTITVLGILAVVVWRVAWTAPDGRLQLTLLEVGTGDAILIQTPGGRYALVNGGASTSLLSDGLGRRLPPFRHELDWLVVASPRSEQIAGLPRLIERFPPTRVLWAGLPSASRQADYLRESLTALQIPVIPALVGHALDLGNGASLKVLTAGNRGAILLLEWDRFRALLPLGLSEGDLDSLGMGAKIGPVSVVLLADNGYAPANPPAWITNLNPQLVLLSVAPDDRNGLPDRETLEALRGYTLLRTDQHGWIQVTTDGQRMWVEAKNKQVIR
jgi:competence protein ComEC